MQSGSFGGNGFSDVAGMQTNWGSNENQIVRNRGRDSGQSESTGGAKQISPRGVGSRGPRNFTDFK